MNQEAPKQKTLSEIQQAYQNAAVKAGHIQYQIFTLEKDLKLLNDDMRSLNAEAPAAKKAEEDAAKAAAEQKAKEEESAKPQEEKSN